MTQGETQFYLREIHSHWCTSNVSGDKLTELQAARLIEMNCTPVVAVRLTSEGAKFKTSGRPPGSNGKGISPRENDFRQQRAKKVVARANAWE
jgi:hypothetical protein